MISYWVALIGVIVAAIVSSIATRLYLTNMIAKDLTPVMDKLSETMLEAQHDIERLQTELVKVIKKMKKEDDDLPDFLS